MESLSDRMTQVGNKSSGLKDKVEELSHTMMNDQFIKREEQNMGEPWDIAKSPNVKTVGIEGEE